MTRNTAKHWGKLAIRHLFFSRFLPWWKWRKNCHFQHRFSPFMLTIFAIIFLPFSPFIFSRKAMAKAENGHIKLSLIINLHYYTVHNIRVIHPIVFFSKFLHPPLCFGLLGQRPKSQYNTKSEDFKIWLFFNHSTND